MSARWIDLVDPSPAELESLPFRLDPESIEILCAPAGDGRDARPTLESHGAHVVGVFLVPRHVDDHDRFDYLEIDAIATSGVLVTIRKTGRNREVVEAGPLASAVEGGHEVGFLLHRVVDLVADAYLDAVDGLYLEIDELEDTVDTLPSDDVRRRLALLRHEIHHARRNASATRAAARRVLDGRLDVGRDELFPEPVERAFADTYDALVRVTEELDIARDLLAGVRDYVQSRVFESQNEVVKKLTVIASLVLVPTLITGFYGQNFAGAFDDWWWSVGTSAALIVGSTVAQVIFFRWRRWI